MLDEAQVWVKWLLSHTVMDRGGRANMDFKLWNKPESSDSSKGLCTWIFMIKDLKRQPGLK